MPGCVPFAWGYTNPLRAGYIDGLSLEGSLYCTVTRSHRKHSGSNRGNAYCRENWGSIRF